MTWMDTPETRAASKVYEGIRMEMRAGMLYTLPELIERLDHVTDDPERFLNMMAEDGFIAVHARRYYLTPAGIALARP